VLRISEKQARVVVLAQVLAQVRVRLALLVLAPMVQAHSARLPVLVGSGLMRALPGSAHGVPAQAQPTSVV
jgi:hypothetical protein